MTTSNSPLSALKAQAAGIAKMLKQAERGTLPDPDGRIAASRARGKFKTGIVMDDKIVTIELPWSTITETDEAGIAEFILQQMRGKPDAAH